MIMYCAKSYLNSLSIRPLTEWQCFWPSYWYQQQYMEEFKHRLKGECLILKSGLSECKSQPWLLFLKLDMHCYDTDGRKSFKNLFEQWILMRRPLSLLTLDCMILLLVSYSLLTFCCFKSSIGWLLWLFRTKNMYISTLLKLYKKWVCFNLGNHVKEA